jgi:aspartate kinase
MNREGGYSVGLIVQKYGGTSVGDIERIRNVARRVIETKEKGNQVVVVVSAMAGETDRLLSLAHQVSKTPNERELDVILATGEQVSIGLLSLAIQEMGHKAISFTGFQVGIQTDNAHTKARITSINAQRVEQALKQEAIAIVAGFQGITEEEDVTTLGRGGSDLTGVAMALALQADVCEIYTDVDGVYTADPNLVPEARKLSKISYDEMLEMASLGAKVLQSRSVEFAKNHGVPIHVRSSFNNNPGTMVVKEDADMERVVVSGVTYNKNEAKISILGVPDKPGIAAQLFGKVAEDHIVVDMIIQNISQNGHTDISFTVPKPDLRRTLEIVNEIAGEIGAERVISDEKISKVSIVGVGMRSHSGVASAMFTCLGKEGINIQMISTSEIKISCIIDSKYTELAVRALHDVFKLGEGGTSEES